VAIYAGRNVYHRGAAAADARPGAARAGETCAAAMRSGTGNYLANLVLYPGRAEFVGFLPDNTQAVVVQPIGTGGVLIAGTDTQRGFSRLDQAWMAALADKLEVSLEGYRGPGAGFAAAKAGGGKGSGGRGG